VLEEDQVSVMDILHQNSDADIDIYMKVKDVLSFYALAGIILPHFTKKSNT
jgi:hypothetical protein